MSCSGVESIHFTLQAPLINDLCPVSYSGWLSCYSNFAPTSLHPSSANPPEATPLFILQRHNTTKWMHLNISADTNNKCTNKDSNIAGREKKKYACMEHKFSKRHSSACVFLFIHSLYNQADVWRADHNPVYGKRVRQKTKVGSQT